jgi:hypothetical protein
LKQHLFFHTAFNVQPAAMSDVEDTATARSFQSIGDPSQSIQIKVPRFSLSTSKFAIVPCVYYPVNLLDALAKLTQKIHQMEHNGHGW